MDNNYNFNNDYTLLRVPIYKSNYISQSTERIN